MTINLQRPIHQEQSSDIAAVFSLKQFLTVLVFAVLLVSGCEPIQPPAPEQTLNEPAGLRPDAPAYAVHGPFWVGFRQLVSGEGSARPLGVNMWYPALNAAGDKEAIVYDVVLKDATWSPDSKPVVHGHALLNAPVDDAQGPYPLVILSPGFSLSTAAYSTLAEQYASYGFVVLAPEHQEQFDLTFGDLWKALIDRPSDVKQTLDFAEMLSEDGEMAKLIDMEHVAVVGHSYGGYTALAVAGAQYDLTAYNARCAQLAEEDPLTFFCAPIVPMQAEMAARAGLENIPEGLWPSFGDPRVKAIIPMAGDSYLFDEAGLSKINIPIMAMGGLADTGTPYDWGAKPAYDYVASNDKILVGFVGGEHMIFTTPCEQQPWMQEHPAYRFYCLDPVWDRTRALDLVHHFSTAFLLATLKNDQAAHSALLVDAVRFPGIEYATTLQ
jgi:predicted dienelactone hydrolase